MNAFLNGESYIHYIDSMRPNVEQRGNLSQRRDLTKRALKTAVDISPELDGNITRRCGCGCCRLMPNNIEKTKKRRDTATSRVLKFLTTSIVTEERCFEKDQSELSTATSEIVIQKGIPTWDDNIEIDAEPEKEAPPPKDQAVTVPMLNLQSRKGKRRSSALPTQGCDADNSNERINRSTNTNRILDRRRRRCVGKREIAVGLQLILLTVPQLIRLLGFILGVTCISHYCFEFSSLLLPQKRVRCQISSVRSDFIYIIVFALCFLSPVVTPVITSNAVFPMDAAAGNNDRGDGEISHPVEGVVGRKVEMNCEITASRRDDSVYMVLWFRGEESIPIYSLDVRGKPFNAAKHWSAENPFGKRAHFRTVSEPARLVVEDAKTSDQGIYRCRVDFRNSPSRETRLNLTIVVPPQIPQIYVSKGLGFRREVGPYREGNTLELDCIVRDGIPIPSVYWYLNDELYDTSYHVEKDDVVNHIQVPNIQRSHHGALLTCNASNTILIPPASKTVIIELNLRPLTVLILNRNIQLSSDTPIEITCESWGSHPAPSMTWWLDNRELKGAKPEEIRSSNSSVSRLSFTPSHSVDGQSLICRAENPLIVGSAIEDTWQLKVILSRLSFTPSHSVDGQSLICRAENPLIVGSAIEDTWQLKVIYSPILSLRMGSSLNPNDIKEGDDVYFECHIKANPSIHKLSWYHNGVMLHYNQSSGVILSNQSLVLQKVSRPSAGNYSCKALNQRGSGTSNQVLLEIMYAPACQTELSGTDPVIIAASRSEIVNITCEMDALPDNLNFHWTHTNTVGETTVIVPEIYSSQGSRSLLRYHLLKEDDFGTLLCWASNPIGNAERPCVYQLVPADCPQPVENCSIINRTSTSVEITCEPGFDGGLPQSFFLEAFQSAPLGRRGLQFNISSSSPTFSLTGLDADGTFHFKIYSVNRKGRSSPSVMDGIALHYPSMQHAKVRDLEKTTIAIIIGAGSAIFLAVVSLIAFVIHRMRHPISSGELDKSYSREFRPSRRSSTNDELYHHNNSKKLPTDPTMEIPFTATSDFDEDGDPDLIPSKNVKTSMGIGKTYSRLSNGEINQRYGLGGTMEKIPSRCLDPDVPLTMEQAAMAMSNYATFRGKPNGLGLKRREPPRHTEVGMGMSSSGSFHGKPSSVVVNIDTRLIGQQLASNQLPESCV